LQNERLDIYEHMENNRIPQIIPFMKNVPHEKPQNKATDYQSWMNVRNSKNNT